MHHFITDNKANVVGLVMAGSADFKTELQMSDLFDPRLLVRGVSCRVVDAYAGMPASLPADEFRGPSSLSWGAARTDHPHPLSWCAPVQKVVIKTVDVSYGGENGFNQAIELAGETLGSVKLIQVGRQSSATAAPPQLITGMKE